MSLFDRLSILLKYMSTRDKSGWPCGSQKALQFSEEHSPESSLDEMALPNVPGGDLSMIGAEDGHTWYEMVPFWRAYRPWLEARGFYPFEVRSGGLSGGYIFPSATQCPAVFPYATFANVELDLSLRSIPFPKFAPARDTHMRDIMIKLAKKGSDEHRIYEDLLHWSELSGQDLQGVLFPVAILDSQYDFCFIVMPRWGEYNPLETLDTVGGILTLMRCLLKGLTFLHSRRIVHRDIDLHNIMVNYYTFGIYTKKFIHALDEHRRGPNAVHCLMDFDRSLKLSSDTSLDACRLPVEAAMVSTTPFRPLDFNLAEYDYNPFAYDVGCLGNMFRIMYPEIVPIIPMLAPLFDRMTTHVVSERFKAAEALAFFEDVTGHLQGDMLDMRVELSMDPDQLDDPLDIYWSKLPADFSKMPGVYRTPPPSLARRLLNAIARYRIGWKVLAFLRRVLRV